MTQWYGCIRCCCTVRGLTHSYLYAQVQLSANIVNVDPLEQKMTLDWVINYNCEAIGCPDVNIYFDSYVLHP